MIRLKASDGEVRVFECSNANFAHDEISREVWTEAVGHVEMLVRARDYYKILRSDLMRLEIR